MPNDWEPENVSGVAGEQHRDVVHVLVGPAGSGKTRGLLQRYRRRLIAGPVGCGLWLAPNGWTATAVRDGLLDRSLSVCFEPNVYTFAGFGDAIVREAAAAQRFREASPAILRPISDLAKRSILSRVVEELRGTGSLFAPIAHTPGFIDALSDLISELKRAEIWPDELLGAATRRGLTARDEEIVAMYRRYQEFLAARQLYDREGRMWLARDSLARGFRGRFAGVRLVVVDGFTDFTRTQYDMLESLAGTADELLVSLPYEKDAQRRELFATTAETLRQLRERFQAVRVDLVRDKRAGASVQAALAALERGLFRDPRRRNAANDGKGLEILEAPGHEGEARMVAQRIKTLLLQGVAPDDVAVVLRRLDDEGPLVCEVFREQGIPHCAALETTLARCPDVMALMAVLALPEHNWRFGRLATVLSSTYFRPRWPQWSETSRGEVVAALRRLRIPFGRDAYLRGLERTAQRPRGDGADGAQAKRAAALLVRWAQCLEGLPVRATPGGWLTALKSMAEELGIAGGAWAPVQEDGPGLERLFEALEQWAWAERLNGTATIERGELLNTLGRILRWEKVSRAGARDGRVRILSASDVRNLRVPYLFVAGLAEGRFPQSRGEDPFYGEPDRESLSRRGLALGHRTARLQEEMLLFYSVVTRAEKLLVLSYPAVDEQGAPLLASPFLDEVRRVFTDAALKVERRELLDHLPAVEELCGAADLRVRAVADAAEGRPALLAGLAGCAVHAAVAENVLAGLRLTHERFQVRSFGPYDGIVAGTPAAGAVAERFGPAYAFSPSQLGTYQTCPFRFYLSSVLGLEPQQTPDWQSSPAVRGQVVHEVLAELHRRLRQREDGKTSPGEVPREELLAEFSALVDRFMGHLVPAAERGMPLWDLERRLLLQWGGAYGEQHREYEQRWPTVEAAPQPTYFELSFGMGGESARESAQESTADRWSMAEPLVLGDGPSEVRVRGRIDRVDVGRHGGGAVFNVIDYKTGSHVPGKASVQSGRDLQLPLYVLAVERLFAPRLDVGAGSAHAAEAAGLCAGYWMIQGAGFQETLTLGELEGDRVHENEQWVALRERTGAIVAEIAAGIRQAEFPVFSADDQCTRYCPFSTVCRVNQVRLLEKRWPV